jgi:hypothetical protein
MYAPCFSSCLDTSSDDERVPVPHIKVEVAPVPEAAAVVIAAPAAAVPLAAPVCPSRLATGVDTWAACRYAFRRGNDEDLARALQLDELLLSLEQSKHKRLKAQVISARVRQRDFLPMLTHKSTRDDPMLQPLRDAVARAKAAVSARTGTAVGRLLVKAVKSLAAAFGDGDQPLHNDTSDGLSSQGSFSHLTYLTSGSRSTALPKYSREYTDFLAPDFPLAPQVGAVSDADFLSRQQLAHGLLYDRAGSYEDTRVTAGDSLLFDQAILHHGTANDDPHHERRVLFVMLIGTPTPHYDRSHVFSSNFRLKFARPFYQSKK